MLIFHCGESNTGSQRELLDKYLEIFRVSKNDSVDYLEANKKEKMFSDLMGLEEE
jgi:hypothetical protein